MTIVTYVSAGFAPALDLTLPSWLQNSGATDIRVYTDNSAMVDTRHNVNVHRKYLETKNDGPTSWKRKIEVIQDALDAGWIKGELVYLDADVYCTGLITDAFNKMGFTDIGATRMFNNTRRGHGAINAGVLFFKHTAGTLQFVRDWKALSSELEPQGWFEQEAASRLIHQAFDGLKPYYAAPLSENIYNCEDDDDKKWIDRIHRFKPKLIHFKGGRWKNQALVDSVMLMIKPAEWFVESPSVFMQTA